MADRICTFCGSNVPEGHGLCPSCNRLVASTVPVEKMPEGQLPPGYTDEPDAIYGRVGEQGYVPPTAHRILTTRKVKRPVWVVALWAAGFAVAVIAGIVAVVYLVTG